MIRFLSLARRLNTDHYAPLVFSKLMWLILFSLLLASETLPARESPVSQSEAVFEMNAGLSDTWINPVTDGQGFFITAFPLSGGGNLDQLNGDPVNGFWTLEVKDLSDGVEGVLQSWCITNGIE